MKNVEENKLVSCIFMTLDEFREAAGRALSILGVNKVEVSCGIDGISIQSDMKELTTGELHQALSIYFGAIVQSIHIDHCEYTGVWIAYEDEEESEPVPAEKTCPSLLKPLLNEDAVKALKPGDTVFFKEREGQAYLVKEVIGKPYFDELIGLWFVATNCGYYRQDVLYILNNLPKEPSKEVQNLPSFRPLTHEEFLNLRDGDHHLIKSLIEDKEYFVSVTITGKPFYIDRQLYITTNLGSYSECEVYTMI